MGHFTTAAQLAATGSNSHSQTSRNPPARPTPSENPWTSFELARIAAIDWLSSEVHLNDGEIAKVMHIDPTDVFRIRTRRRRGPPTIETDDARTQAAPLGD